LEITVGAESPNFKKYFENVPEAKSERVFSIITRERSLDIIVDDDTIKNAFIRGLTFLKKRLQLNTTRIGGVPRRSKSDVDSSMCVPELYRKGSYSNPSSFDILKPIGNKTYLEDTQKRLIFSRMCKGDFFLKLKLTKMGFPHERSFRLEWTARKWALCWMSGEKENILKKIYLVNVAELRMGSFDNLDGGGWVSGGPEIEEKQRRSIEIDPSPFSSTNSSLNTEDDDLGGGLFDAVSPNSQNETRWGRMNRRAAKTHNDKIVNSQSPSKPDDHLSFSLFNQEGAVVLRLVAPNEKQLELWRVGLNLIINGEFLPRSVADEAKWEETVRGPDFDKTNYEALSEDEDSISMLSSVSRMSSLGETEDEADIEVIERNVSESVISGKKRGSRGVNRIKEGLNKLRGR